MSWVGNEAYLRDAVRCVAEMFVDMMNDCGAETVAEMKKCYGMDADDVKAKVADCLHEDMHGLAWIDEEDGSMVYSSDGGEIDYRSFMSHVYSGVKMIQRGEA